MAYLVAVVVKEEMVAGSGGLEAMVAVTMAEVEWAHDKNHL